MDITCCSFASDSTKTRSPWTRLTIPWRFFIGVNVLLGSWHFFQRGVTSFLYENRVILQLSETFRWKLVPYDLPSVVLHTVTLISSHLWWMLGGSFEFE